MQSFFYNRPRKILTHHLHFSIEWLLFHETSCKFYAVVHIFPLKKKT